MTSKATPKAGLTLLSQDSGDLKFLHSSTASADFDLKHKFHKRLTLGAGFTDNTVRKVQSLPGLVLSGDIKVRDDLDLALSHNLSTKALKSTVTYATKVNGKKTTIKGSYITKGNVFLGEVATQLAPNKKTTVNFDNKQVTNVKLALTDGPFTYEPSYNLVKKAPSLAVSRPLGKGKYKFGWNLKTDDLMLEYTMDMFKIVALKRPGVNVPTVGLSLEKGFTL